MADAKLFSDMMRKLKDEGSPREYLLIMVDESTDEGNMITVRSCTDLLFNAAMCNKAATMELKEEIDERNASHRKLSEFMNNLSPNNGKTVN